MIDQVQVPKVDEMGPTFKGGGILRIKPNYKKKKTSKSNFVGKVILY